MSQGSGFFIMRPFNGLFLVCMAFFALVLVLGSVWLRKKPDPVRRRVLAAVCVLTLIGFFVYKYQLSIDAEYDRAYAVMGGFSWWSELPLHVCNINMILIPIAVLTDSRPLMSFSFFIGPLGALMALVMPGLGFSGYSIFLPRMLGYYGTHFMIIIEALAIVTLGLYRPKFRDLPKTILTFFLIAVVIFGIDVLMRSTGLNPKANYFYLMETEGNGLLEIFHRWIPLPFLYMLPCIAILAVYMVAVTAGFALTGRKGETAEA